MQISLILFFLTGILFSVLAIPLIRKKVKINSWYGIRVPKTMESEAVWYEVNAVVGRYIFFFGILISVLTLYFIMNPTDPEYLMVYTLLVILITGSVIMVIMSYKVSDRISSKYSE